MKQGKSLKCMVSTQNARGNMEVRQHGNCSQTYLTTCPLRQSLTTGYSACMQVCPPPFSTLETLKILRGFRRYRMKDPSLILCGQIQTQTTLGSRYQQGGLATCLELMWLTGSCMRIIWIKYTEHINSAWKGTKVCLMVNSAQCGVPPTTVTALKIWRVFWN